MAAWCSSFDLLLEIGLINHHGRDAFCRRVISPCRQHDQVVEHHKNSIQFGYRCFDRLLLNGLIRPFQQPERVLGFFNVYREERG